MSGPQNSDPPRHVAVIMDGNGRWAKQRGLNRLRGHEEGARSVRAVLQGCRNLGIHYLTLYAFSVENWRRPHNEVRGLMLLLRRYLAEDEKDLHENRVQFRTIGRTTDLPAPLRKTLADVTEKTKNYERGVLTLALSYGGRAEITDATRAIAEKVKQGVLSPEDITEETIAAHLYDPTLPDPELMIRTSGEMRLSNFLLWQLSYSELYITETLWPDFREEHLREAVAAYQQRHRRFGNIS